VDGEKVNSAEAHADSNRGFVLRAGRKMKRFDP